jgi:hypothetical protein
MKAGKDLKELAAEIMRQAETKKDYIASTAVMKVEPFENDVGLRVGDKGVFPINDIAHNQIAEHVKIPRQYYDKMRKEDRELLGTNVDRWFAKYPAPRLVRTLDGRDRAFLSDKFGCFDNVDFAGAALPILRDRQLDIMSCEITEKRLYIKAVDTKLFRDVPVGYKMGDGSHRIFETFAPAIILSNSEVGFGRLVIETGVYTSACTNLALFAKGGMKRTHVGARHVLAENMDVQDLDEVLSAQTKAKTLEALWLQARDVIGSAFNEQIVMKRVEAMAATNDNKITGKVEKVVEVVKEKFSLNESEGESMLKHLIAGGNLSQYGISAALTRTAHDVDSYDRSTELEYAGGAVIELPRNEWQRIAETA